MFSVNYKVTISDINYGGHMGNERALLLFQQVRIVEWTLAGSKTEHKN